MFLVSLTLKGIKNTKTSIDLPQWIREIAIKFTHLKSLRIRQLVIRDSDLELLAKNQGKDLLSLKICECKGFSENGLMCVAKCCSELTELCLEIINLVVDDEVVEEREKWLRVLALRRTRLRSSRICMLQKMREQIARLKAEVEWAAQEAASSQNTFRDFLAGCSSSYTPHPMYTPQAVPDGSGSSSRMKPRLLPRNAFEDFLAYYNRQQLQAGRPLSTPEVVPGISAPQVFLPDPNLNNPTFAPGTSQIPCDESQSDDE
ncbi:ribonuclease H-like domain, reverse transcriptase, RNA-dependent DNA polymerase [Tanacetum coccineum]